MTVNSTLFAGVNYRRRAGLLDFLIEQHGKKLFGSCFIATADLKMYNRPAHQFCSSWVEYAP